MLLVLGLSVLVTACNDADQRADTAKANVAANAAEPTGSLPFFASQDFTPNWIKPGSNELQSFHTIPDFRFTNQDGKQVSSETYRGKIYVASFFFSLCPGICSPVNLNLMRVQDEFLKDDQVRILSHTITPETDTVPILNDYATKRSIDSQRWDLVTGNKAAIFTLAKKGYFANDDMGKSERPGDLQHTENIVLVDQNRYIRGVYNGLSSRAMLDLIEDIKVLKAEMAAQASS